VARWAVWLSAGIVIIVLAFGGIRWLGQAVRTSVSPDLAAFTRSSVVRADDRSAAGWLAQEASRLASRAKWLAVVGDAQVDECAGAGGGGRLFGGGIGASVSCERTDTRFFATASSARGDVSRLERALAKADGWGRFAAVPSGSASPPVLPMTTAAWVGPAGPAPPPGGKVELHLIWVDANRELAAAALGAARAQISADRVSYLLVIRPNLAEVARRSFAAHLHVLVVSIEDSYFYSSSLTPPGSMTGSAGTAS
jgi:hypothetical protein